MKKIFLISSLCISLFASCTTTKKTNLPSSSSTSKKIAYKIVTQRESTNAVEVKYSYPQFSGQDTLNALIKKMREEASVIAMNDLKKDWNDFSKEQKLNGSKEEVPPFDYNVECNPVIATSPYISMLFTTYTYSGGAHGEYTLDALTYDVNSQKEVSITEISGYTINEIAQHCHDYLVKNLRYGNGSKEAEEDRIAWIAEGTIPNESNYTAFTCDGKILTIYFEPYRVAPYASGIQRVTMPVKK